MYDVTSSGLTQAESWFLVPHNYNRVGDTVGGKGGNNFGTLEVDFRSIDPLLRFDVRVADGSSALRQEIR